MSATGQVGPAQQEAARDSFISAVNTEPNKDIRQSGIPRFLISIKRQINTIYESEFAAYRIRISIPCYVFYNQKGPIDYALYIGADIQRRVGQC